MEQIQGFRLNWSAIQRAKNQLREEEENERIKQDLRDLGIQWA